jgi:hypothetical protein
VNAGDMKLDRICEKTKYNIYRDLRLIGNYQQPINDIKELNADFIYIESPLPMNDKWCSFDSPAGIYDLANYRECNLQKIVK